MAAILLYTKKTRNHIRVFHYFLSKTKMTLAKTNSMFVLLGKEFARFPGARHNAHENCREEYRTFSFTRPTKSFG
jgi:hypothetical protein